MRRSGFVAASLSHGRNYPARTELTTGSNPTMAYEPLLCTVFILKLLNMKRLKNYEKTICGIQYKIFAIIKNQKTSKYCYYISTPWSKNVGDKMIYKSKTKSIMLNRYTLSALAVFYTLLVCTIAYPAMAIFFPIYNYFDGARNFIRNRMWAQNERYFNWCNMFIIAGLIVWLILK